MFKGFFKTKKKEESADEKSDTTTDEQHPVSADPGASATESNAAASASPGNDDKEEQGGDKDKDKKKAIDVKEKEKIAGSEEVAATPPPSETKEKKKSMFGKLFGSKTKANKEEVASANKEEAAVTSPSKDDETTASPSKGDAAPLSSKEEEVEEITTIAGKGIIETPLNEGNKGDDSVQLSSENTEAASDSQMPKESDDPGENAKKDEVVSEEGEGKQSEEPIESSEEGESREKVPVSDTGDGAKVEETNKESSETEIAPTPAKDSGEIEDRPKEELSDDEKQRGRRGRETKAKESHADSTMATAPVSTDPADDPEVGSNIAGAGTGGVTKKKFKDDSKLSSQPDLAEVTKLTEHFRSKLQGAVGAEVYTQFMEVCRSLEEQSNVDSLRGELELDQFMQVVKAFDVEGVSEDELQVVFSNFCHLSEDGTVPVLNYERFLHNLCFVRSVNELLESVKSSILELARSDRGADSKLEHYFTHYESEKRDAARSQAADEDRLMDFDLATYQDFKKSINTLGVGFHELETTRLFCALRASQQVPSTTILKAVEAGGSDDTPRSIGGRGDDVASALLDLFRTLPDRSSSSDSLQAGSAHSSRKRGEKRSVPTGPPMRGLRSSDQLLGDFREMLSLVKRVLPLPQPANSSHSWYIAGQLLSRMAAKEKVPTGSVSIVSTAVLIAFIKDFSSLAISVPESFRVVDSVLHATSGELRRLSHFLNSSQGAPEDWQSYSKGNADLTQSDFLSFPALVQLLDLPRDEGLFINKLHGDLNMEKLVAMAASKLKLPQPVVDTYEAKTFLCSVKSVLVDKNEKGEEEEDEELWSSRLSLSGESSSGEGLVWEATGDVLPVGVSLEETASHDPRWRLVFDFFESNTMPSPIATLVSVAQEVDGATPSGDEKEKFAEEGAPSTEATASAPAPAPAPAEAPSDPKATFFRARRSFTYMELVLHFAASYSVVADAASIKDGLLVSVGFGPVEMHGEEHVTTIDFKLDVVLARMMTGPIRREARQSSSANTLAAVTGELSNLQYLVSDLVTALLMRSKRETDGEADMIVTKPTSRRKTQRQEAEKQGHVGGRAVLTKGVAMTKIQSLWRSKKVRRHQKKSMYAAVVIQSAYRGSSQRYRYQKTLSSKLYEKSLEDSHKSRVKSLRSKERELLMIKQIPGSEFLNFDRMRKDGSAKIIQRVWRRKSSARGFEAVGESKGVLGSPQRESEHSAARRAQGKMLLSHITENSRLNKLDGVQADKILPLQLDTDAIGLAQLQRRVKDEVSRKGASAGKAGTLESMVAFQSMQHKIRRDRSGRGAASVRESYKDLGDLQRKAGVLIGGYLSSRDDINARKVERLQTLANIKQLVGELKDPPSLADAKKTIDSVRTRSVSSKKEEDKRQIAQDSWYTSVPLQTLPTAVDKHLGTLDAMDSKSSWGNVASPHDMTGPPINIGQLSTKDHARLFKDDGEKASSMRRGLASAWLKGADEDHSLLWVSYSAQPSKLDKKQTRTPSPDRSESKLDDYHPVLAKLVRENMQVNKRREIISKRVKSDKRKVDDVASVYSNQSIALMNRHRAGQIAKGLSEMERERKHVAATRIQAAQRKKMAKARVESLRAEQRVMAALSVLMTELRRPELRPETKQNLIGLSSVPIDAKMVEMMHAQKTKPQRLPSPSRVPLAPRQQHFHEQSFSATAGNPSRSPDHSLDVSAMTERPTPARSSNGGVTLSIPEEKGFDIGGFNNAPSPGSMLPRTPVGNPHARDSALQESRLSAATEGTVRGAMGSFEAGASGVGYVSSPGDTLSQSAVSTTLFSSPGPAAAAAHYAPLTSERASKAMQKVSGALASGAVSIEGIVSSALTANPANFRRDGAFTFLRGLVNACTGPAPISMWLKGHSVGGEKSSLDVKTAGLLLGGLARELNLLDDENEGPYLLIQAVLLLRLLAGSWDDGCVPVRDLNLLLEDNMGDGNKRQVIQNLNMARFDITQLAGLRDQTGEALFDDAVAKEPALQKGGDALLSLTVDQVSLLLVRLSPSALEGPQQQQLAEHLVSLTTGDTTGVTYLSEIKSLLCCAPHPDFVENRLQTYFRAAPSLFDSLAEQVKIRLQRHLNESKLREAVAASDLPLSGIEVLIVAHMIVAVADDTDGATAGVLNVISNIKNGVRSFAN